MRKNVLYLCLILTMLASACSDGLFPNEDVRIWAADSSIYVENHSPRRVYTLHFQESLLPLIDWSASVPQKDTGGIAAGQRFRIPLGSADKGVPIVVFYWWRRQDANGQAVVERMSERRIVP